MEYTLEPNRPMKHVDRKALYTRLEARITYLRDFLDFNSGSSTSILVAFDHQLTAWM